MEREVTAYLSTSTEHRWGLLPERLRGIVGTEVEWLKLLRAHCVSVQAPWAPALGGDEATYLHEVLATSRERGMLYPYHLEAVTSASKSSALESPFGESPMHEATCALLSRPAACRATAAQAAAAARAPYAE